MHHKLLTTLILVGSLNSDGKVLQNGTVGTSIRSLVRIRSGGLYDKLDPPVVDMFNVVVSGSTVHVYDADDQSKKAIKAVNGKLGGLSLRAHHVQGFYIVEHETPLQDPCVAEALFFVKPWFWGNLYHLVNDAAMIAYHVSTAPGHPGGLQLAPRLLVVDERSSKKSQEKHLSWARILFGFSIFPAGISKKNSGLEMLQARKTCVGGLHWGQPLRVASSNEVSAAERARAMDRLWGIVQRECEAPNQTQPSLSHDRVHNGSLAQELLENGVRLNSDNARKLTASTVYSKRPRAIFVVRSKPANLADKKATRWGRWYNNAALTGLRASFESLGW